MLERLEMRKPPPNEACRADPRAIPGPFRRMAAAFSAFLTCC